MARMREPGVVRMQTFGLLISSDDEIATLVGEACSSSVNVQTWLFSVTQDLVMPGTKKNKVSTPRGTYRFDSTGTAII
jgi:hypothetical protein